MPIRRHTVRLTPAEHTALSGVLAWVEAHGDETEWHETTTKTEHRKLAAAMEAVWRAKSEPTV